MATLSNKTSFTVAALLYVFSMAYAFAADNSLQAIAKRIAPVAKVNVASTTPPEKSAEAPQQQAEKTTNSPKPSETASNGEKIYTAHCKVCHETGAAGAPKIADANAWETRSKQGVTTLIEHAIKGYKLMPPKGACVKCTDEDIKEAVNYMLKQVSS